MAVEFQQRKYWRLFNRRISFRNKTPGSDEKSSFPKTLLEIAPDKGHSSRPTSPYEEKKASCPSAHDVLGRWDLQRLQSFVLMCFKDSPLTAQNGPGTPSLRGCWSSMALLVMIPISRIQEASAPVTGNHGLLPCFLIWQLQWCCWSESIWLILLLSRFPQILFCQALALVPLVRWVLRHQAFFTASSGARHFFSA